MRLALYELPGKRSDPVLLFGHACGFPAGAYLPLLQKLTAIARVFAYDARGHGGSDAAQGDASLYAPDPYALDLACVARAVADRTDGAPIFYIAHSMSAASFLHLGALHREAFARAPWREALLFEPPVFPSPDALGYAAIVDEDRKVKAALGRRRRVWQGRQAFVDALAGRGAFAAMQPEFVDAYARAALRPDKDGYTLACSPEVEVATFTNFASDRTFQALPTFPAGVPVHIVGGDPERGSDSGWTTRFAPAIARQLGAAGRFTRLPGRGHFMLQEDPETIIGLAATALANT
jgi:pimeloyl-ACP methyl ester carboxylesterase